MHSRRATQLATEGLADAARLLASGISEDQALTPADRVRMRRAFEKLAHEMDTRSGRIPRTTRPEPVDPDQVPLWTNEQEHDR